MAGGVASAAQLLGNLAHGQRQLRAEPVQDTALAHAGISGEGHQLPADHISQLLHALAGFGTGGDHPEARIGVDPDQIVGRVQVGLVDAEDHLNLLVAGNGRYPVNEEGLRHRVHVGGEHHQRVHIGNSRTDELVPPGEDPLHHALSLLNGDFHHITGQGRLMGAAQMASGPAGHRAVLRAHLIKSAEGPNDPAFAFFHHQPNSTFTVL